MAMSEELSLEQELEQQLVEHKASLVTLDEALLQDPANQELLAVREELLLAVKGAEESLFHLKRDRLLREVDLLSPAPVTTCVDKHLEETNLNSNSDTNHVSLNENLHLLEKEGFFLGSKCRFRYTNGRWYNGEVMDIQDGMARISFLTPTEERMQICRFYLQQRCRFGANCRSSHGVLVEPCALRKYVPHRWQETSVGSTVLACVSGSFGLWRYAELENWDENLGKGQVVFVDDGRRAEVNIDTLSYSEHAELSDESSTSSEDDDDNDDEDDVSVSIEDIASSSLFGGLMNTVETNNEQKAVPFAKWEKHTRGVASKMMSNMGYKAGMGLGVCGQGILAPIQVAVLPSRQSLDSIRESVENGKLVANTEPAASTKKKRGGKRSRDKKLAAAARQAKSEEERVPDVFNFINNQLASQKGLQDSADFSGRGEPKEASTKSKRPRQDYQSLFRHEGEVTEIKSKVSRLEEMARRNRKEKAIYNAVCLKLDEARKALILAESAHLSATQAAHKKDQESRWLRF